ncbi:transglycosylase domain-containing protein [Anaerobacillus isosaccharinicus]|uniref:Monofunctional biosynthetic peptidoglycan transglycosylase n=1 Tax=Anaerobacillus isosaccharinicus TaxID=1532552 RepID=A0A1S2L0D9_9BACI|nr:PBP1A family penicillin-binding protein [Anaerobacillus isosaccharinicus]MBA5584321.1 PBP1A family penicillin-binding protein [Anaerobacillus isosaccharinicus]QOY37281.1 PBP1A family penicillin-binding protein [Anaerobacillus isosaccharinicus]
MEVITRKKYHRKIGLIRRLIRLTLVLAILLMGSVVGLLSYAKMQGPPPLQVQQTTVFYGSDESIIGQRVVGQNRHWISLSEIDPAVIEATVAIEDRKFHRHYGFDFIRIGSAVLKNVQQGTKAQGASTITQQYARNLFLSHDKTWQRKINEAIYALRLEMNYTKEQILEGYLNTIYYGHGAYGIEAAANYYFQKSASELNIAEASMLAGIPKGPLYYSPIRNYDRAKSRQQQVLNAMANEGYITNLEANDYYNTPLNLEHDTVNSVAVGPYFQEVVYQILTDDYGLDPQLIEAGGLQIYTTLDPTMQAKAEKWVEEELKGTELQTALVAIDPRSGDVRAMVGGRNYLESQFNRATQARRMPGSAMKPILYYAALENGFTPATPLTSEETTFIYDDGRETYAPSNFNNKYANDFMTLAKAMALSDNIYAMKTHFFLGFDQMTNTAERLGITSTLAEIPSLALGTKLVGVLELTNSYSAFANGGKKVEPRFITKVVDRDGKVLLEQEPVVEQILDPNLAYIMTDLMTGMFDLNLSSSHSEVTGRSIVHLVNRPVAGKSGTTVSDSWMIGYTPQLLTGVWVGHDQANLQRGEGQYAKRIWAKFIEDALEDKLRLPFPKPSNVVAMAINPDNGRLATDACPVQHVSYFVKGTEPVEYCQVHIDNPSSVSEIQKEIAEIEEAKKEKLMKRFIKWFSGGE